MEFVDDRTDEQKQTHTMIALGTDSFMSGWGGAEGGASYAGWAFPEGHESAAMGMVAARSEMQRVRLLSGDYKPNSRYCAHCHIYVFKDRHAEL